MPPETIFAHVDEFSMVWGQTNRTIQRVPHGLGFSEENVLNTSVSTEQVIIYPCLVYHLPPTTNKHASKFHNRNLNTPQMHAIHKW